MLHAILLIFVRRLLEWILFSKSLFISLFPYLDRNRFIFQWGHLAFYQRLVPAYLLCLAFGKHMPNINSLNLACRNFLLPLRALFLWILYHLLFTNCLTRLCSFRAHLDLLLYLSILLSLCTFLILFWRIFCVRFIKVKRLLRLLILIIRR